MSHLVETVASKAMGALKSAKAKIGGLTGVFAQLSREHGEVTALLLRVKASSDPKVREELFPTIRAELLAHEKGELLEVYPAFREHAELADFADEHDREAQELQLQLEALEGVEYTDPKWADLFAELVQRVSRHVKDEESRFFPVASRILGPDEAERMLAQYQATKRLAMQNLP
jgi:hypothetical protein